MLMAGQWWSPTLHCDSHCGDLSREGGGAGSVDAVRRGSKTHLHAEPEASGVPRLPGGHARADREHGTVLRG